MRFLCTEHRSALDTAAKLDPSNAVQLETLHAYFSYNQAAVDFYLAQCLLPQEVQHFPSRLASSPWDLADNAHGRVSEGRPGTVG